MNSVIFQGVLALLNLLNQWYEHSVTHRVARWCHQQVVSSLLVGPIHRYVTQKNTRDYLGGSWVSRVGIGMTALFVNLLKGLFGWLAKLNSGSVNQRVLVGIHHLMTNSTVFTRMVKTSVPGRLVNWLCPEFRLTFFATFMLFMSVMPDSWWSNLLILVGALVFTGLFVLDYCLGHHQGLDKRYLLSSLWVYVLFSVISFFTGFGGMDSVRVFLIVLSAIVLSVLIPQLVDTLPKFEHLVFVVLMGLVLTAVYGFVQVYLGIEISASFVDLQAQAGLPGRLYSTMGNPNNYAKFVTMLLPFVTVFALTARSNFKKLVLLGLVVPVVVALVLTFSRASYLVLGGMVGIYVLLVMPRLIPVVLFVGVLAIPLVPQVLIDRVLTIGTDTSSLYRVWIWEGAWRMIGDYWSSGVGIGPHAFNMIYRAHAHPQASNAMHAHNVFLNTWVEIGVAGFMALVVYNVAVAKQGLSRFFTQTQTAPFSKLALYLAAGVSSLAGFIMFSMVEHVWFYPRTMLTYFVVMGMIMALVRLQDQETERS